MPPEGHPPTPPGRFHRRQALHARDQSSRGHFPQDGIDADRLAATPGLVEHGLFPPELVATVLIGRGESVEQRVLR